jgi:hypothetical protein
LWWINGRKWSGNGSGFGSAQPSAATSTELEGVSSGGTEASFMDPEVTRSVETIRSRIRYGAVRLVAADEGGRVLDGL